MKFEPREHQNLMSNWLTSKNEAAIFAGCGLGKTASTLHAHEQNIVDGASRGALVVAPLRVSVLTWPNEVEKWDNFKWLKCVSLRTKEGIQAWHDQSADIYTLNYEQLQQFCAKYLKGVRGRNLPVDTVVWDEISKAKNPSSKRIRAFRGHRQKFSRHWGLTGTPMPNGYLDLFAQCRLLDDGKLFGRAMSGYKKAFFEQADYHGYKWKLRKGAKDTIDRRLAKLALTLRSEDWLDIPPTRVHDVEIKLSAKVKKQYKEMQKEFLLELERGEISAATKAVLTQKLLQLTSGAIFDEARNVHHVHNSKVEALLKLQKELKEPLLVATMFTHEKERLSKLDGAYEFKNNLLDKWNAGKIPILYAHPASIGHGLNLQDGGRHVVWFGLTYDSEFYEQFNARLARTGQQHETHIWRLIAPGTIDDAVAESLRSKDNEQKGLLAALVNLQRLARADV